MGKILSKILLFGVLLACSGMYAQTFRVVLDAGHGGDDPGTNHNKYREKDIVLATVLKIGKILDREPGIDLVYTRKTDVFIELRERANIANRAQADLFVSVHCNGVDSPQAFGTETFVMSHNRSAMNLEVAKKENSVIYKEKDYKEKYKGFDPNKPEFSVAMSLQQEANLEKSAVLASKISTGFKSLKKKDRGIKQIPLWVLDATTMPGVLIELGFVSHKEEGAYLNSEDGQDELAATIANAIINYKNLMVGKPGRETVIEKQVAEKDDVQVVQDKADNDVKKDKNDDGNKGITYKVQISASSRNLETKSSNFKGLKNISKLKDGKLIKYYYGEADSYNDAEDLLKKAKAKGYTSAYIVAFKNDKQVTITEALKK